MYRHATVNFSNQNPETHFNSFTPVVQPAGSITLSSIIVTNFPERTVYFTGETLDLSGLAITASYSDGSSKSVTDYTTNPGSSTILSNSGSISVLVNYTESGVIRNTSFNITVNSVSLTGISVTSEPTKSIYFTGDTLDLSGLEISAFYSSGSSNVVTGYTTNPSNSTILNNSGTNIIQVSFIEGDVTRNTSFSITVNTAQGSGGINLDVEQIVDEAPLFGIIVISRTNTGFPVNFTVSVNESDFDTGSIRWEVAGVGVFAGNTVSGLGASFTLEASNTIYNSLGGHNLHLTVRKNGIEYQRAIPFTIMH
jgi:hypothetical protein